MTGQLFADATYTEPPHQRATTCHDCTAPATHNIRRRHNNGIDVDKLPPRCEAHALALEYRYTEGYRYSISQRPVLAETVTVDFGSPSTKEQAA